MRAAFSNFFHSLVGYFAMSAATSFFLLVVTVLHEGNVTLKNAIFENIKGNAHQTSKLLNLTVSTYLAKNDLKTIGIFFTELLDGEQDNGLTYVTVTGADHRILLSTRGNGQSLPEADNITDLHEKIFSKTEIHIRNPFLLAGREAGFLQFGLSTKALVEAAMKAQQASFIRSCIALLLVFTFMLLLCLRISRRLKELTRASQTIVLGDYRLSIAVSGKDEIATLAKNFNFMAFEISRRIAEITSLNEQLEQRVISRTSELAAANLLQEQHLRNLRETQEQLIFSEKLAGLGALVAGVAHELNTPIGNALTVTTTLSEKVREIRQSFEIGQIKRGNLIRFFSDVDEADLLLVHNINRASELINSFKTIAVDQTSEFRRQFLLDKTLHELELTLQLQLKRKNISLILEIDPDLLLDSYPGPLTQVIINLFNNALIHAFESRDQGLIKILAYPDPVDRQFVVIGFKDDGCGIPGNILPRIFDPFFTTKFGQGGSGLGLHISFNIVHGVLGGSITVYSEPGLGSEFIIRIPKVAPLRKNSS